MMKQREEKHAPECAEFRKSNKYYEDSVVVATYEEWGWSEWWQDFTVNTEKKREKKNSRSMRVPILQEMYTQCQIFRLLVQVQRFTFARFYAYKRRVNIVYKTFTVSKSTYLSTALSIHGSRGLVFGGENTHLYWIYEKISILIGEVVSNPGSQLFHSLNLKKTTTKNPPKQNKQTHTHTKKTNPWRRSFVPVLQHHHVFPIDWICSLAFILSEAILEFLGSAEHWYTAGGGHMEPMWGRWGLCPRPGELRKEDGKDVGMEGGGEGV